MKRNIYLSATLLTLLFACSATRKTQSGTTLKTKVDIITTAKEAEKLLHSFGNTYAQMQVTGIPDYLDALYKKNNTPLLYTVKSKADSLSITESFYKADFDQNGYTDLLVFGNTNGYSLDMLAIMSYPNDSLSIQPLYTGEFDFALPKVNTNGTVSLYSYSGDEVTGTLLTHKYGSFIEYNNRPASYTIDSISFGTTPCFGTCPVFSMKLTKKGKSVYEAKKFNNPKTEAFASEKSQLYTTDLKAEHWNELTSLLNYMDFTALKDEYRVYYTDAQTAVLTIYYNNGKVKHISDYGLHGTLGLEQLYNKLYELRFTENWQPEKNNSK